jgi:CelD/BcsL family acetyltransferase involved in cellulose biosynthesis
MLALSQRYQRIMKTFVVLKRKKRSTKRRTDVFRETPVRAFRNNTPQQKDALYLNPKMASMTLILGYAKAIMAYVCATGLCSSAL